MTREAKGIIYNEVLEATAMLATWENTEEEAECLERFIEASNMAIEALSQPERPKGRWVEGRMFANREEPYHEKVNSFLYCSNCECEAYWDTDYGQQTFDFCPNCGADMRGVEE